MCGCLCHSGYLLTAKCENTSSILPDLYSGGHLHVVLDFTSQTEVSLAMTNTQNVLIHHFIGPLIYAVFVIILFYNKYSFIV